MRRAPRTDANQAEIAVALAAHGCRVQSLAGVGDGCPDLLVGTPDKRLILLEVKDGAKPPSARKLTDDQQRWHREWEGWPVYVVSSVEEAISACLAR